MRRKGGGRCRGGMGVLEKEEGGARWRRRWRRRDVVAVGGGAR